jgi:hypothetical protein
MPERISMNDWRLKSQPNPETDDVFVSDDTQEVGLSSDEIEAYIRDVPPTNNISGLEITETANADGSVNIELKWDYVQGTVKADGFLVFFKSSLNAPETINMNADPAVFVAWTDN